MGMCTRRAEPENAHTSTGITVPLLALCKKVRRPSFATWHDKTTLRKQVHLPEYIRVHWYGPWNSKLDTLSMVACSTAGSNEGGTW